jgi:hypothetical protein
MPLLFHPKNATEKYHFSNYSDSSSINWSTEMLYGVIYLKRWGITQPHVLLLLLLLLLRACPLMPRKHLSLRLIVLTLNILHHRFSSPVSLIKRQRSLTEAVLISFGCANSSPKIL